MCFFDASTHTQRINATTRLRPVVSLTWGNHLLNFRKVASVGYTPWVLNLSLTAQRDTDNCGSCALYQLRVGPNHELSHLYEQCNKNLDADNSLSSKFEPQ